MSQIQFQETERFMRDLKSLSRYPVKRALLALKRLLEKQFHPISPENIIGPGKLHRITSLEQFVLWKIEMSVKNLRKNQSPRIWFGVRGAIIVFFCAKTHTDNYNDFEVAEEAKTLAIDYFGNL